MKNYKQGFGIGTLVVIIALVLIVGGYIYYSNQPATTETGTPTAPVTQ